MSEEKNVQNKTNNDFVNAIDLAEEVVKVTSELLSECDGNARSKLVELQQKAFRYLVYRARRKSLRRWKK